MVKIDYLVTGTGRCGTVYMARLLTSLGIPCSHEAIFNPGGLQRAKRLLNGFGPIRNSYCSTNDLINNIPIEKWVDLNNICAESSYMAGPFISDELFSKTKIIHVVRHPLKVISSHIKDVKFFEPNNDIVVPWINFVLEHLPHLNEIKNPIEKACYYYTNWNLMIEQQSLFERSYLQHRVEDKCSELLLDFLNVKKNSKVFEDTRINSWNVRNYDLKLSDIPDGSIKEDFIRIGEKYGYDMKSEESVDVRPVKKPLFRITIGPVHELGFRIMRQNIKLLKKNYPEADIVVCYNQIDPKKLNVDVETIDQSKFINTLPYLPKSETWKLYPPRMRLESHEIVLDNDILLLRRVPEIDRFLQSNRSLLLSGRMRVYGKYEHLVPHPFAINTGIFGLPPYFDFKEEIYNFCKDDKEKEWTHWCDDQGVISGILLKNSPIIISMNSVMNYLNDFEHKFSDHWNGIHFVGANRGDCNFENLSDLLEKLEHLDLVKEQMQNGPVFLRKIKNVSFVED